MGTIPALADIALVAAVHGCQFFDAPGKLFFGEGLGQVGQLRQPDIFRQGFVDELIKALDSDLGQHHCLVLLGNPDMTGSEIVFGHYYN